MWFLNAKNKGMSKGKNGKENQAESTKLDQREHLVMLKAHTCNITIRSKSTSNNIEWKLWLWQNYDYDKDNKEREILTCISNLSQLCWTMNKQINTTWNCNQYSMFLYIFEIWC